MKPHQSGSPQAQQQRKAAYRKQSGAVSNPGQPSPTNRKARRAQMNLDALTLSRDQLFGGPST